MKPQVLHVNLGDGFLITVNGLHSDREFLRKIFEIELAGELGAWEFRVPRTEVEFGGRDANGARLDLYQVRCIANYKKLTDVVGETTVTSAENNEARGT